MASSLYRYSIYNLKLFRRGVHLDLPQEPVLLSEIYVREAMTEDVISVRPDHTVYEAAELLESTKHHGFPVVDDDGHLHGILTVGAVRDALAAGKKDARVHALATHDVVVALPPETLNDALRTPALKDAWRLHVVDPADHR